MKKIIMTLGFAASFCIQANPDVISREYKLMLKASQFSYNNEASAVSSFLGTAETEIENAISRNVTGTASLSKVREVKFFDVSGSCELSNNGYSFRERIENSHSEVTLKYRSPDRYISDFENLSANSNQSVTKLEADIGVSSTSNFKVVYGHSTKAPNTRTINKMDDINEQYPGFDQNYAFNDNLSLALVGNLVIREHVYKGMEIDLGSFDAEISVTLWYNGVPSGAQKPVVAEVSFKYEDSSADYSKKVVNRAKIAFEALQNLTAWTDPNSKTKTRFVYDFNSTFCF
ncbi:hypothetical protein [Aliikangiella sp. IMCC44359]|uniref:hypothetical protein n=1 Tax=Aliikangiella sp. IMCC44359 TaxID=3459125 RepID=UPI00403B1938